MACELGEEGRGGGETETDGGGDRRSGQFDARPTPSYPPPTPAEGAIVDPKHAPESVRRAEPPGDALCVLLFGPPSVKVREKGRPGGGS